MSAGRRRRRAPPDRLRIAFVSDAILPFNSGGKETRLREVSARLAERGHDVHIYTMRWWPDGAPTAVDGVTVHALCRHLPLYRGGRRSILQAFVFGLATLRMIGERFDVMDVDQMPFFPLFGARLVCYVRRRPLVATWHEVWGREYWRSYLGPAGRLAAVIERLAFRMPDRIVSDSAHTTERLLAQGVRRPITTVALGADVERIASLTPAGTASDVIYAGRLLPNKNVSLLLDAVSLLVPDHPVVQCIVVGEGPERASLEDRARLLAITAHVDFRDFFPDHDVLMSLLKRSRVFVLPSVREGFGLVVLEANACGLPVVTIDHPDNASRLLIEDGRNGFVVPLDAWAIAKAIERALDLGDRSSMGPAAGDGDKSTWSTVATRMEAVFYEMGGSGAPLVDEKVAG